MPEYYRHTLANGKTVMETAPTIQWGYLIYLTVLRLCQYFGAHEECGFCDINHNWRQHKREGRPYTGVKPVEDVLEALALIDRYDTAKASQAYTLTGGSVTSTVDGLARGGLLRPLRAGDRGALPRPLDRQGRRAGAAEGGRRSATRTTASDLPPELRGLGQAALLDHLARARSATSAARSGTAGSSTRPRCSAPRHVIPNFVAGVEMAKPFGFETVDEAIAQHDRGARLLHEPRHHAALHDVVPGADDAARPRQPRRRAARVPRPPARRLPGRRSSGTA